LLDGCHDALLLCNDTLAPLDGCICREPQAMNSQAGMRNSIEWRFDPIAQSEMKEGASLMIRSAAASMLILGVLMGRPAAAEPRLPTIPPDQYTEEQKKAAEEFLAARKAPVFGPFEPMMHSPAVMNLARSMGDYLRYRSSIGNTLSELVILITAREWSQDYEWHVHYPIALKAGIAKEVADAVGDGRRPAE
jgi:hypothetical protein